MRNALATHAGLDAGRRMLLGDLLTYLPDNMLLRGDRVSMSASIEARMPLLDFRVLERVSALPAHKRSGMWEAKRILRDSVRDIVPAELFRLPKRGLPVPITELLLQDNRRPVQEILLSDRCLERGLLEPREVENLVGAGERGADVGLKLFTLFSLETWLRIHVDRAFAEPPRSLDELLAG